MTTFRAGICILILSVLYALAGFWLWALCGMDPVVGVAWTVTALTGMVVGFSVLVWWMMSAP